MLKLEGILESSFNLSVCSSESQVQNVQIILGSAFYRKIITLLKQTYSTVILTTKVPVTARFHRPPFYSDIQICSYFTYNPKHRRIHRVRGRKSCPIKVCSQCKGWSQSCSSTNEVTAKILPCVPKVTCCYKTHVCGPLP